MRRETLPLDDRRYAVIDEWGSPPDGIPFGAISSVAIDAQGRVFVFQRRRPPVIVFDEAGELVMAWENLEIRDPHGIEISPDGYIYLVDRDGHSLFKCTADGQVIFRIGDGKPAYGRPFNHPTDVTIAEDGEFFVSDGYGNAHVHHFAADGTLIDSWGEFGTGPGQLNLPHAIVLDSGLLYVADRENDRIQIFDTAGSFVAEWPGFHRPADIYIDPAGLVFICDLSTRVHVLTKEGKHVASGRSGASCHGMAGDPHGNLFLSWPLPTRRLEKWQRV